MVAFSTSQMSRGAPWRAPWSAPKSAPAVHRGLVRTHAEEASASDVGIEASGPDLTPVKDIDAIMKALPHRVIECEPGKHAVGYKNVTINDEFFNGHFPGRPIMPGVLQLEAMAQLGGIVMLPEDGPAGEFFFGGVEGLRWRKPVVPGDVLMMRVEVKKFNKRFGVCKMDAKAYVGEELVCEAELTLVMAKDS